MHDTAFSPVPRTRRVPAPGLPLKPAGQAILDRAGEILTEAGVSAGERLVRLQVVRATLTGTVIRATGDYPEMRNPHYWELVNNRFVVMDGRSPAEAVADLWTPHHHDGVPIPRIRCLKYSSLMLIQGYVQHFRETGDEAGLDALDRLIGDRVIPQELPDSGDNILWRRHPGGSKLLPGDQVWFDNPFYDKGRSFYHKRFLREALAAGKPRAEALEEADDAAAAMTAGEEGSNSFYLGDGLFTLGADALAQPYRDSSPDGGPAGHELEFARKIFTFEGFQEHMIDDNFSVQLCLRANPDAVRAECFTIERVRSPLDPEHLMRHDRITFPAGHVGRMIDETASANTAPELVRKAGATVPVFPAGYDWAEQRRVRLALETLMRARCDETWWEIFSAAGDGRYVLTASRGGETRNFTVGMLCADLAFQRLCLGVTSHLPSVPGRLPGWFRPEKVFQENRGQWREEGRPLHEMQAALCREALAQAAALSGTEPGADGRGHSYTADEKERFTAALEREIAWLESSRTAHSEEVTLPLRPAPNGWEGYDAATAAQSRLA